MTPDISAIEARVKAATPGPWRWFGHAKHGMYLATTWGGRIFVMDFVRQGMNGAQPRFQQRVNGQKPGGGRMTPASEIAILEVAPLNYRDDIVGIDNPDADFIAHARTDIPALLEANDQLAQQLREAEGDPRGETKALMDRIDALESLLDRIEQRAALSPLGFDAGADRKTLRLQGVMFAHWIAEQRALTRADQ